MSPASFRWIRTAPSRIASTLKAAADREYVRSLHLVIGSPSGSDRFAMFGGHHLRHHFGRIYLGVADRQRVRVAWHRGQLDQACLDAARRYGLAVLSDDSVPASLQPHTLRLPFMVEFEKRLPPSMDAPGAGWSRSARDDISRVKRAGFRVTVDHGVTDWMPWFLREFAAPAMVRRHGTEGYTPTRRKVRELAAQGGIEFIRVWNGDECLGGIVNQPEHDAYRLCFLGWREGNDALLRQRVVAALYWFSMRRALELGIRQCRFGGARPYLEDGLVFYKSKWGATLDAASRRYPDVHLLVDPEHPACRRFLDRQSLILRGFDDQFIVFSRRSPREMSLPASLMTSVSRWYRWRDRPSSTETDHPDVPQGLRRWVAEERWAVC